jgi:hypothetical protein
MTNRIAATPWTLDRARLGTASALLGWLSACGTPPAPAANPPPLATVWIPPAASAAPAAPAPRTPACVLRSRNPIEPIPHPVSSGGAALATEVSGDVEVRIFDEREGVVRAEKHDLVLEGTIAVPGLLFHGPRSRRVGAVLRPRVLRAVSFDGGALRGAFELPSALSLASDVPRALDVPCSEAAVGYLARDEATAVGGDRELVREKQVLELRADAEGPVAARLALANVIGVNVLERRAARARVRFATGGGSSFGLDATEVEAWVDVTVFKRLPPARPGSDTPNLIGIVGGPSGPRPPRPSADFFVCKGELPLYAASDRGRRRVGFAKPRAKLAFGAREGGVVRIVGAGWWLNAGKMFHNPMRLADGVTLVAKEADTSAAACSREGTWELP